MIQVTWRQVQQWILRSVFSSIQGHAGVMRLWALRSSLQQCQRGVLTPVIMFRLLQRPTCRNSGGFNTHICTDTQTNSTFWESCFYLANYPRVAYRGVSSSQLQAGKGISGTRVHSLRFVDLQIPQTLYLYSRNYTDAAEAFHENNTQSCSSVYQMPLSERA